MVAMAVVLLNLFLPERMVGHRGCCYDGWGNLKPGMHCHEEQAKIPLQLAIDNAQPSCCGAVEYKLRPAPSSQMDTALLSAGEQFGHASVSVQDSVPRPEPMPSRSLAAETTGPPGPCILLPLHSRWNL